MKVEQAGRTIGDLEREGYTHIHCRCENCQRVVQYPFRMIRESKPDMGLKRMMFSRLAEKMRCKNCTVSDMAFKPWRRG
jgi:hypothetical protein